MSWKAYDENPFAAESAHKSSTSLLTPSHDTEAPAWLREAQQEQIAGDGAKEASDAQLQLNTDVPKIILYTRVANLVLSVCMILASLLSLLTTEDATTGVLACYVVVFSCLLCCFETHLKQVSKVIALNFGFLYSAKSRSVFMVFVGTILFSFSLFGKLIGLAMLANAAFNMYAIVMYPGYEDAQRKDAQAEIQDFLSANPAYAQQAFSLGMKAGTDMMASNPELAKQGAQVLFSQAIPKFAGAPSTGYAEL